MLFQDGRSGFLGFVSLSSLLINHYNHFLSPCCHLPPILLFCVALLVVSLNNHFSLRWLKKTDTILITLNCPVSTFSMHVHPFSHDQLDWHVKHQIIGYQQTIIHIIHPIVIQGRRLMMSPANHEADMMGALEQQSGVAVWQNRRMMFEHVVNRPEMWMTNDQCWFLIKLMSVLFMELCLIE